MKLTSAGLLLILTGAAMTLFIDFEPVPAHAAATYASAQVSN
ncbi:hypothetical protein [Roseibium sp.]